MTLDSNHLKYKTRFRDVQRTFLNLVCLNKKKKKEKYKGILLLKIGYML